MDQRVYLSESLRLFFTILIAINIHHCASQEDDYVKFSDFETSTSVLEGETTVTNFKIVGFYLEGFYKIEMDITDNMEYFEMTAEFDDAFDEISGPFENDTFNIYVTIKGLKLGIGEMDIYAEEMDSGEKNHLARHYVKVLRSEPMAARVIRILVISSIAIVIFLIGITTDLKIVGRILRKPWGVFIGLLCQFVIMPATAYALAKLFKIDGAASVGFILDGSCPGGQLSNVLSVLLDVDYVLSITMTFFSTILAMGMMPLNLLIYGSSFVAAGKTIQTPFTDILMQMVILFIPLALGIFISQKWPKSRDFADKYIKPMAGASMIIMISADLPFNIYIFNAPPRYIVAAILFPFIGATLGFILAKLTCLYTQSAIAVGIETGVQNAILAISVLYFFYPRPESDLGVRLPYLIAIFTMIEGFIAIAIYLPLKKFYWKGSPYKDPYEDIVTLVKNEEVDGKDKNGNVAPLSEIVTKKDTEENGPAVDNPGFSKDESIS